MRRTRSNGFTLIEVMVALAIFALGAISLSLASSSAAESARRLEERMFARWVAKNEIAEIRLANTFPALDETKKTVKYVGREWTLKVKALPVPTMEDKVDYIRQVEVEVYLKQSPDQRIDLLVTYVGKV
ncbi:type II secretion system minor pseudopilin GspI [Gynuella sunshinyii]|uniref:Type II secretion system protein I n=1 Tax=Gynuella sunshinyii YC6258 TaxID=1445510 RepID=A0A0C5VMC8_9GAMM|nr:type II secretion system minor pseudopilin GspI [Gynuella sunshinyii]AJQ95872.1 type II secretory pathway, pseudopilin PulG [Gynuella sunshinyii YC6258]